MSSNSATSLPDFDSIYPLVASFNDAAEEFERIIRRVYEALLNPGDKAVDIGAHTGKHSAPLALSVTPGGTVVALEPIPWAFERLRERAARAGLGSLEVRHLCAGAETHESVTFMVVPSRPGWSAKAARPGTDVEEISVGQTTVDAIADEVGAIRFLKIDVEGAEPEVIAGAHKVLKSARPVVHIEVSPDALAANGHELSLLRDQLVGHGYQIFDLLGFDVSAPAMWAASAPATGVFDYIAAHPDAGDDVALVTTVLSRSFAPERHDLSLHRMPELLGKAERASCRAAGFTEPSVIDSAVHQVGSTFEAGPISPQGTVWPTGSAVVGRFLLVWKGEHNGLLLDHVDGSIREVDGGTIAIDMDGFADVLNPGHQVKIDLDLSGVTAARNHQTIVELHLPDSGTNGVCRIHKSGKLEVLWVRGRSTLQVDGTVFSPGQVRVSVTRSNTEWVLRASGSSGAVEVKLSGCSDELLDLVIGRRRFWSSQEQLNTREIPVRIINGAERSESFASAYGRTAKQRAKSLLSRNPLRKTVARRLRATMKASP